MTRSFLLSLLALLTACGPGTATNTDTATATAAPSTGPDTSAAPTTGAPTDTGDPSTTEAADTGASTDTGATATTGGGCLEFSSDDNLNGEIPPQFTCSHTAELCPPAMAGPLFHFEGSPESDDTATTQDLPRVHCVLEALRDRQLGQLEFELGYDILGDDTGTVEIAGEFVIVRRQVTDDFFFEYTERVLQLEAPEVFAECRTKNTTNVAWGCLRPYLVGLPVAPACVEAPLQCG